MIDQPLTNGEKSGTGTISSNDLGVASDTARVLFDIGHPADAHLFKNAIRELDANGHRTFVTSREKECTTELLDASRIEHVPISTQRDGLFSLATEWVGRERRLWSIVRSFKPDVVVSYLSPAVHVASLAGCSSVVYLDGENQRLLERVTSPFVTRICTPANFEGTFGTKQLRYDGFHELAYLHPDRFDPDPQLLEDHGIAVDEPYYILRFVSWEAHHDVGQQGFSRAAKRELIEYLDEHGEVYISSENPLPDEFEPYRLPVPPEMMHQLLYFADLYVGDSGTMATEAAVLGTPAVRSNTHAGTTADMSNFRELEERYDLLYSSPHEKAALAKVKELVADPTTKETWQRRRDRLLADKIDVTEQMIALILREAGCNAR